MFPQNYPTFNVWGIMNIHLNRMMQVNFRNPHINVHNIIRPGCTPGNKLKQINSFKSS